MGSSEQKRARIRVAYRRFLASRGIPRKDTVNLPIDALRSLMRAWVRNHLKTEREKSMMKLDFEIPREIYDALAKLARYRGETVEDVIAQAIEEKLQRGPK